MNEENEVLNSNTLIERIKNCIDVSSRKKNMPIMIRNNSNLMEIIDTSLENDVLYIDVQDAKTKQGYPEDDPIEEMAQYAPEDSATMTLRRSRRRVEPIMENGIYEQMVRRASIGNDLSFSDFMNSYSTSNSISLNTEMPADLSEAVEVGRIG